MGHANSRGQSSIEAVIVLLFFVALVLGYEGYAEAGAGIFKSTTLSEELWHFTP